MGDKKEKGRESRNTERWGKRGIKRKEEKRSRRETKDGRKGTRRKWRWRKCCDHGMEDANHQTRTKTLHRELTTNTTQRPPCNTKSAPHTPKHH